MCVCTESLTVSTSLNPVGCWSSACPHGAIVNLFQFASTKYDIDPVWPFSPTSTHCDVGPVHVPVELLLLYKPTSSGTWCCPGKKIMQFAYITDTKANSCETLPNQGNQNFSCFSYLKKYFFKKKKYNVITEL